MIFAFSKAYPHIRARRYALHREWMIRSFAKGLSIGFFRVALEHVLLANDVAFTPAWNTVDIDTQHFAPKALVTRRRNSAIAPRCNIKTSHNVMKVIRFSSHNWI
jgi:hypothetical protein